MTPPILRSGNVVRNLENTFEKSEKEKAVKITMEDEIAYWKSSIVCYVLGANPPLSVLDGFVRRIWSGKIDKVGLLSYGVFLIRFDTMEHRDEVLNGGYIFFNKRLVIMKAWDPNTNFKNEDIRTIPIWVQLTDLELKYWGQRALFKIIGQVGEPIMVDDATKERDKLSYPRVLIQVSIHQEFPGTIYFEDEHGNNIPVEIFYEWKPIRCGNCKGIGHATLDCRKKESLKQEWVVKNDKRKAEEKPKPAPREFQAVTKGWKIKAKEPITGPSTSNSFQALQGNSLIEEAVT
ncbi:uncharacterized protein LOC115725539 [Cannabis sativa]|uniref:uncharacterized protein LOC115725539 n=1 Tax=Cannabis sativa TaxID=3483 RepID=UPI0011E04E74|nr:uncharacterized protein LOC115725539 [Cannabis sativa]